jgi:hypothetical protein
MEPMKLMVIGSSQKRLMKRKMKKEMGQNLILRVTILRIYKWTQVLFTQNLAFPPNLLKLIRLKNLLMILKASLKLRLVVQNSYQLLRPQNSLQVLGCRRKSLPLCKNLILQALFDSYYRRNKIQPPLLASIPQVILRPQMLR